MKPQNIQSMEQEAKGFISLIVTTILASITLSDMEIIARIFAGFGAGIAGLFTAYYHYKKSKK